MSEAQNTGHKKLGEIYLDDEKRLVVLTTFGTFKLELSKETPANERKLLGLLDVLNNRKPT
jgi:hypothetical protein